MRMTGEEEAEGLPLPPSLKHCHRCNPILTYQLKSPQKAATQPQPRRLGYSKLEMVESFFVRWMEEHQPSWTPASG